MMESAAAIVGIYEHPARLLPTTSVPRIKAACAAGALADAGLDWADVDGLYDAGEAGGALPPSGCIHGSSTAPRPVEAPMRCCWHMPHGTSSWVASGSR
jgi:acetyl-CoA C-acetyltransferase